MINLLIILIIIFVLTYDPRSRTLEHIVCYDESNRYVNQQFGLQNKCPPKEVNSYLGALT